MSLLGMSEESLRGILDCFKVGECQNLVRGCLPQFQEAQREMSLPLANYLVNRWSVLRSFVNNEMSTFNALLLIHLFVSITWCDCCNQKKSHNTYRSSDGTKIWSFCLECDEKMLESGGKPDNFCWISRSEIPFDLDLSSSAYKYLVLCTSELRSKSVPILDEGKLQIKVYLLKDLLDTNK